MSAARKYEETFPEPPVVAGRVPPNDLDAEAAVLSTVMLRGRAALADVSDVLQPSDFYSEANRRIYQTAQALDADDRPIDTLTVASALRTQERLQQVGGVAYLAQLVDATPAVAHVREHAIIVADKALVRRAILACQTIAAEGYGDIGPVDQWLDSAEARVCAAASEGIAKEDDPSTPQEIITAIFADFQAEARGEVASVVRVPTGIADLDGILKGGGLAVGGVTATGAYWGVGKTSLALQIGTNVALSGHRGPPSKDDAGKVVPGTKTGVAFFSLEMSKAELIERALAQIAKVDVSKNKAAWNGDEWSAVTAASQRLTTAPLWVDDLSDQSPTSIRSRLRRMKAQARKVGVEIRLVIIDYLQLVEGKTGVPARAERREVVDYLARSMKLIARSEGVHLIAVAQLNDDASKRTGDPRPASKDFRESKAIPMNADNCLLIHNPFARARALARRDSKAGNAAPESEVVELILDKQRGGRTGTVRALFQPSFTAFAGYDGRHYEDDNS